MGAGKRKKWLVMGWEEKFYNWVGNEGEMKIAGKRGRVALERMDVPMRGWATNPLMGPASHTNDVSCSDNPKLNKNGVPYLPTKSVSTSVITRCDDSQKRH